MADKPSKESNNKTSGPPPAEELKPKDDSAEAPEPKPAAAGDGKTRPIRPRHHGAYRPSHKATFIGLAVVALILVVNVGVISFVINSQSKKATSKAMQGQVTVNQAALDKLGVYRNQAADKGIQLTINPDTTFGGNVKVGGNTSVGGQLILNGKFTASSASFTQLQAGDTALQKINVNGDGTMSNLALRNGLTVNGTTQFQGVVTVAQLFTVNSSANISGNLSVGGMLAVAAFHAGNIASDGGLAFGGHVITSGARPGLTRYSSSVFGSNGTASNSGNEQSGTVGINIGAGSSGSGCLVRVNFHNTYSNTPHVVITPMGDVGDFYVRGRDSSGFDICVGNPLSPGGYTFDYVVEQ